MKLAFWRKDMSNFSTIAKKMDDLQSAISAKDTETKDFADKAVAAHAERQALEADLSATRAELSTALDAISGFLASLTVLPPLVTAADKVHDDAIAAEQAEAKRIEDERFAEEKRLADEQERERLAKEQAAADAASAAAQAEADAAAEAASPLSPPPATPSGASDFTAPEPVRDVEEVVLVDVVPEPASAEPAAPAIELDPLTGLPKPAL
jgi:septal ring factor EnvC (AmiA/AmiB activator)